MLPWREYLAITLWLMMRRMFGFFEGVGSTYHGKFDTPWSWRSSYCRPFRGVCLRPKETLPNFVARPYMVTSSARLILLRAPAAPG
jgi:hypothetical protein